MTSAKAEVVETADAGSTDIHITSMPAAATGSKMKSGKALSFLGKVWNSITSCFGSMGKKPEEQPPSVPGVSNAPESVPEFVVKYAPLVYLHPEDQYGPSDISAQVANTTPKQEFKKVLSEAATASLTLENLDQLNALGKQGEDIYLTSNDDVSKTPTWIQGAKPDENGKTKGAVSCVVAVVEKEGGIVDAFYFYFYAFNWGGIVLGKNLGNHVGDWEHTMVRFVNGVPQSVWLSQHSGGQGFKYAVLKKDKAGIRPVVYSAKGSHANYAISGLHNHDNADFHLPTPGFVNDYCEAGPIWDPVASAYWYKWTAPPAPPAKAKSAKAASSPANVTAKSDGAKELTGVQVPISLADLSTRDTKTLGTFAAYDSSTSPLGYLYFVGRWGDFRYPKSDPRQDELFSLAWRYDSGPTGPAFKNLGRKDIWIGTKGSIYDKLVP